MIFEREINEVYLKLEELFKLKIKRYLPSTGLIFNQLTKSVNLLTNSEFYNLNINGKIFEFINLHTLVRGLISIIKIELEAINHEIDYCEEHKQNDFGGGIPAIHDNLEELFNKESKLTKLEEHLEKVNKQKD